MFVKEELPTSKIAFFGGYCRLSDFKNASICALKGKFCCENAEVPFVKNKTSVRKLIMYFFIWKGKF